MLKASVCNDHPVQIYERVITMADNWGRKSTDLNVTNDMRKVGARANSDLAEALLMVIGVGIAGGAALIAGAKKLGESLQAADEESKKKLEAQREAYNEAVRKAAEHEYEIEYDIHKDDEEFNMAPSPLAEQPEEIK